jgi:hypothetical protein
MGRAGGGGSGGGGRGINDGACHLGGSRDVKRRGEYDSTFFVSYYVQLPPTTATGICTGPDPPSCGALPPVPTQVPPGEEDGARGCRGAP